MNNATQVLAAFREMTANKAISRDELHDLIKDGILAALAKRYGPNVEAEIEIDEYEHRVGELLSGEVQQVERGKLVVLLNRAREADAIVPWKEQNPRERFRQGET